MCCGASASTPRSGPATPSASASTACRCSATASTTSACSSRTTSGCCGSFRCSVFGVRSSDRQHRTPNTEHRTPNTKHRIPMLIPIRWLREYTSFDLDVSDLPERLTMAGLEVEEVREVEGDTVLDIYVTPNRGDCLSMVGVAR